MNYIVLLLHKFYAATISVTADGNMLVASTRERILAWGLVFCIIAATSLTVYLACRRNRLARNLSLCTFTVSLLIPAMVLPSVRQEYIYVTPEKMILETGTWYRPSRTVINFDGLHSVREIADGFMPSNLIGDPDVNWQLSWIDGRETVLEFNDFFNAHRMVVAIYMQDRGHYVTRLEDQIILQ